MTLQNYRLNYYNEELNQLNLLKSTNFFNQKDTIVSGITYNSQDVDVNNLFICKGSAFKVQYLEEAIEKGALGYVSEEKYDLNQDIPHILVTDIRKAMAPIASIFYNYPQEKLKILGIGGTKGKTTTSYFLKAVLDEYLKEQNKKPAGIISSIITYDGINQEESQNTTPEAFELIKHLANGVESGLEYFVLEVSSQALKYHRTDGLNFELGVFLNIDEDHISPIEHPNYEDYLESKLKMFKQTKNLVINNETSEREKVMKKAEKEVENYKTFSMQSQSADYFIDGIKSELVKTYFEVHSKKWDEKYEISMPGLFNVENASAVVAGIDILNISQRFVQKSLVNVKVPGRTEFYQTEDKKIIAVVDFAHNRLSFESLYESVKETYKGYQVVSIFGAPGGKAYGRSKELGTVAGIYSDYVYLTMDDPENEEVMDISENIAVYIKKRNVPYCIIEERKKAINAAFLDVKEKTALLFMGKGHETSLKIKGKQVPYASDSYYVKKFIKAYNDKNL